MFSSIRTTAFAVTMLLLFGCSDVDNNRAPDGIDDNQVPSVGTFVDARDKQTYKTVEMPDGKTWMAQNLNYQTESGSWCYNNDNSNCDTYGRLYDWTTAMDAHPSTNANPSGVRGVCPANWHLPSLDEWFGMLIAMNTYTSATKLKASAGWEPDSDAPVGSNDYGFSALPGGRRYANGSFNEIGWLGYWWTTRVLLIDEPTLICIKSNSENTYDYSYSKNGGMSVRCVRD